MKYAVLTVVAPPGNPAMRCFAEVSMTLAEGLSMLGHDVEETFEVMPGRKHIVLSPNALPFSDIKVPDDSILYNLEQFGPGSPWNTRDYRAMLKKHEVWDYSLYNIASMKRSGIKAKYVPIGYCSRLERATGFRHQDIEVLFLGVPTARRVRIINQLWLNGVNARLVYGLWDWERDEALMRSQIVLNLHTWDTGLFEAVRVSYYLANGRFVISERGLEPEDEEPFEGALIFTDPDYIVAACKQYLAQPLERGAIQAEAQFRMRSRSIERYLEPVVGRGEDDTLESKQDVLAEMYGSAVR